MPALAMLKSIVFDNDMHLENKLFLCAWPESLERSSESFASYFISTYFAEAPSRQKWRVSAKTIGKKNYSQYEKNPSDWRRSGFRQEGWEMWKCSPDCEKIVQTVFFNSPQIK